MASQPPDPPPDEPRINLDLVFQALVASTLIIPTGLTPVSNFVKRVAVPRFQIMLAASRMKYLALSERDLIGQFSGIWPSPKSMDIWISINWMPLIVGELQHCFCGKGFYTFLFENKEDKDLIFRSGPYFMGPRGLYIN